MHCCQPQMQLVRKKYTSENIIYKVIYLVDETINILTIMHYTVIPVRFTVVISEVIPAGIPVVIPVVIPVDIIVISVVITVGISVISVVIAVGISVISVGITVIIVVITVVIPTVIIVVISSCYLSNFTYKGASFLIR